MRALSTSDIDLNDLRRFGSEIGSEFELKVDDRQIVFKSFGAPSWIMFFADANWWIKGLELSAGLYFGEIIKEAGKQTWQDRAKIAKHISTTGNRIAEFVSGLSKLRKRLPQR